MIEIFGDVPILRCFSDVQLYAKLQSDHPAVTAVPEGQTFPAPDKISLSFVNDFVNQSIM